MAFETAIYTDVTKEEAVDGYDGFNFQAISKGLDGNDQRQIRENLLHQISTRWPTDQDERVHPATAAYMREKNTLYFSRGHSTGATNSGRRGNQLTQAIAASNAEDLQPYLPAQIYAATNWRLEKAANKECARWFSPLTIDPSFESDSLWEMLQADEWLLKTLPVYLTMLEQAVNEQGPKVVLIHHDLDTVMRWFAFGTLLLDRETALRLEYRAFATDPFQTRAQLVGVSSILTVGSVAGANVIDLSNQTVSPVEVSEAARYVAGWAARLDLYEALEVIAIAQRWMPALGSRVGAAGAEMVVGMQAAALSREEWELALQVIEGLARDGLNGELLLYFDELTDAVATYQLQGPEDFSRAARAARFGAGAGIEGLTEAILLPTLESLAAEPEHAAVWAHELQKNGDWRWPEVEERAQLIDPLVEIVLGAPDEALPLLLPLVRSLNADEVIGLRLISALNRMIAYLLKYPAAASADMSSWYGASSLRQGLRKSLVTAVENPEHAPTYRQQLRAGDWDFLDPAMSPSDVNEPEALFAAWLEAARIARLPVPERLNALGRITTNPPVNSWKFALHGARLYEDLELFATWLRTVGPDAKLRNLVLNQLRAVLSDDPRTARAKEVQHWLVLAEAFAAGTTSEVQDSPTVREFEQYIKSIPTVREKAKDMTDGFLNILKRKNKDD